ncbi:hypothetical protein LCGC14_1705910 [marine sediment metagenome]|uniref:Uncharacterized protein n=1 Tax=marine sediment metagenome TaxID=412755 RepID=A0A0F9HH45_9ZZZZ
MDRYQEPTIPQTINHYYNEAWRILAKYFRQVTGLPSPNLDMESGYPKGKKEWLEIYNALSTIYLIGQRQRWLRTHVNGLGQPTFLLHEDKNGK